MVCRLSYLVFFFFFKQKTAYEMRISDWSSDVCSSDLLRKILLPAVRIECGELRVVERLRGSEQPQKPRTILTQTGKLCGRHIDPWGTHAAPGIAVRIQDKGATIRHLKDRKSTRLNSSH